MGVEGFRIQLELDLHVCCRLGPIMLILALTVAYWLGTTAGRHVYRAIVIFLISSSYRAEDVESLMTLPALALGA